MQHPFCAEDVNLAINTSRVSRLQSADFDQALNLLDDDDYKEDEPPESPSTTIRKRNLEMVERGGEFV